MIEPLTDKDYMHMLISCGRNASTYKPAWAKVLSDLGKTNSDKKIRLVELGEQLLAKPIESINALVLGGGAIGLLSGLIFSLKILAR